MTAQVAHSRASIAFSRLSDECEILLNQLSQVAADIGITKTVVDSVPAVDDVQSSESELTTACHDTALPLVSGSLSPVERFEVLQRAVRLSRLRVESAAATLDLLQSKLLKAASDHSKIVARPSALPVVNADPASNGYNDLDGDSIHDEKYVVPSSIGSNYSQPHGEQNPVPSAPQPEVTSVPACEAPDMPKLAYNKPDSCAILTGQQSGQRPARPMSTIGLIHPNDSSSDEDEDDDGVFILTH